MVRSRAGARTRAKTKRQEARELLVLKELRRIRKLLEADSEPEDAYEDLVEDLMDEDDES